jgi:hypothetical protein
VILYFLISSGREVKEVVEERSVQVPWLSVRRPITLLAELLREMSPEVTILRHPPSSPNENNEECQGNRDSPVHPEETAEDVVSVVILA